MSKEIPVSKKLFNPQIPLLAHLKDIFKTFKMSITKKISIIILEVIVHSLTESMKKLNFLTLIVH